MKNQTKHSLKEEGKGRKITKSYGKGHGRRQELFGLVLCMLGLKLLHHEVVKGLIIFLSPILIKAPPGH